MTSDGKVNLTVFKRSCYQIQFDPSSPPNYTDSPAFLSVHAELKSLHSHPKNRSDMSQATKVVLGTIGVSIVIGLLLLVGIALV